MAAGLSTPSAPWAATLCISNFVRKQNMGARLQVLEQDCDLNLNAHGLLQIIGSMWNSAYDRKETCTKHHSVINGWKVPLEVQQLGCHVLSYGCWEIFGEKQQEFQLRRCRLSRWSLEQGGERRVAWSSAGERGLGARRWEGCLDLELEQGGGRGASTWCWSRAGGGGTGAGAGRREGCLDLVLEQGQRWGACSAAAAREQRKESSSGGQRARAGAALPGGEICCSPRRGGGCLVWPGGGAVEASGARGLGEHIAILISQE